MDRSTIYAPGPRSARSIAALPTAQSSKFPPLRHRLPRLALELVGPGHRTVEGSGVNGVVAQAAERRHQVDRWRRDQGRDRVLVTWRAPADTLCPTIGSIPPVQTITVRPEPALRHRSNVDDYHRIAEAGVLSREERSR